MIYFDNSATTFPKPNEVYEFMDSFYRQHGVSPGRSGFDSAIETGELLSNTRKLLTQMFNAGGDFNRLTFSYNATDSLNMILQGLIEKGDHVVTTLLEHNAVLRPLYTLEQMGECEVTYLPFDEDGYVSPDDLNMAIKPNTKLFVCTQCSNVIGTIQPINELGKICKEKKILFVVDGSQGAGAIATDMQRDNIDIYVFTGHKSLMGPTGIGGSYVREGVDVKITRFGGTGVRSAQRTHLEEYPYHLEAGTMNMLGVAGLYAGCKWIEKQGLEKLHDQEMRLWTKLRDGLETVKGVTLYCANSITERNPVLSFNIEGFEAGQAGEFLDVDYDIACRTGLQCAPLVHQQIGTFDIHGTIRFSLGAFNTENEIDTAIQAVSEIAAMRN